MSHKSYPKVSIIIPNKDDWNFVLQMLQSLERQTFSSFEVIIIDSSGPDSNFDKANLATLDIDSISVHEEKDAYPGKARNIGVSLARGEFIAFMDAKTVPEKDWLLSSLKQLEDSNSDIILGKFQSVEKKLNWLQRIIKANTYGNLVCKSVPGSVLKKSKFNSSGGFIGSVGAGEDLEWVDRLHKLKWKVTPADNITFKYLGYPLNFRSFIIKWVFYSFENAKINILSTQKTLYFILLLILFLYFIYSWNYLFTYGSWDDSPYFVPNLNKIIWSFIALAYIFLRSIYMPIKKKEKITFILPINWIFIGLVGFTIDLLKIPGRLFGLWRLIFSKSHFL
jgi:glycosyltransferase involved in cell wall biosynthesis